MRDEMLRAKVLIFMVPLVLPIGQPRVEATDRVERVTPAAVQAVETQAISAPEATTRCDR